MKRMKRIIRLSAVVAAALTLGACSQDETAGNGDGTRRPMELTATGLQPMVTPMTRATVDGDWEGVNAVAVKVGSEVKRYAVVTPDVATTGAQALLTCSDVDKFYWPASGGVTVSAWWPYDEADITTKPAVVVKPDQSQETDYAASDYIEAIDQTVTQDNNALEFTHRTAKICVALTDADGSALTGAEVSIAVGGQTVKCYDAQTSGFLALIAPVEQEQLKVMITANGKNYVYKHTTAVEYKANNQYTFKLKVKGNEVVALSGCTIRGWNDYGALADGVEAGVVEGYTIDDNGTYHITTADGLKAWAENISTFTDGNVSAQLDRDITLAGEWTPIRRFSGTFDGNGHIITRLRVSSGDPVGFISRLSGGTVKNLTLADADITGECSAGAVAGICADGGTIENCHVTGSSKVKSTDETSGTVGGIVGSNLSGTILACHVAKECKVSAAVGFAGGIVGENKGAVNGCYALCQVSGSSIGGICGRSENATLAACYSRCELNMEGNFAILCSGGIVGYVLDESSFEACYWDKSICRCNNGVGSETNDPEGVNKMEIMHPSSFDLGAACVAMNNVLTPMGYEYLENSDDEPLVLQAVTN